MTNLRILKSIFLFDVDDKGESKCVGFGLCVDKDSVRRALALDGDKFGTRTLRINLAARR